MGGEIAPVRPQMAWMWAQYAPLADDRELAEVSPSRIDSVPESHPPAVIVAAEFDPLKDEAQGFAEKLSRAGIPVTFRVEPGLMHAFSNMAGAIPEGLAAFDRAVDDAMGHLIK
jgi:acetyl esterase